MSNRVDQAMQEVWDWKRRAEEATRDMDAKTMIEFYRREADKVEQAFGIQLATRPAPNPAQTHGR